MARTTPFRGDSADQREDAEVIADNLLASDAFRIVVPTARAFLASIAARASG
jgi:hypothetical protein